MCDIDSLRSSAAVAWKPQTVIRVSECGVLLVQAIEVPILTARYESSEIFLSMLKSGRSSFTDCGGAKDLSSHASAWNPILLGDHDDLYAGFFTVAFCRGW